MKVNCIKKYLQEASSLSEKIPNKNPSLPILNTVLIKTGKNKLHFLSTNLEVGLRVTIPVEIKEEGKIAVPSKVFSNLVSSLQDDNIKLSTSGENLVVITNSSSTTIKGYPVEDFPILPEIKEKKNFSLSVSDFMSGLRSVYYGVSISEMKPELNSVYLNSSEKNPLTFVATDTFRLAEKIIHYNFSDFPNLLIPYRSVVEILRIFENKDGDLKIKIDDNNILLESDNIQFITRLVDSKYIDYKQIIPTDFTNIATVSKKELLNVLKSSAMFCGKLNEIRIKIYKGENFLEFLSNNSELGEHINNIKGDIEGDDLTSVFNYRYLVECLSSIGTEKIIFKFSGEGKPLLVTGLGDSSFKYLISPMKNI